MKTVCPSCRVPVADDDVNLATGVARCRACNNVFQAGAGPELAAAPAGPRLLAGKPRTMEVTQSGSEMTAEYRWYTRKYIVLALFCIFWDVFLTGWYAATLRRGEGTTALFAVLHVVVGVLVTYLTLAGFVNRTTLRVDRNRITARHHPLPWVGNTELATADVRQMYCEQRVSRGRYGVVYAYDLSALMRDGTRKRLLSNIDTPDIPLFLEQHAEAWVKIADTPVAGEVAR
jgi:hypothetical protein